MINKALETAKYVLRLQLKIAARMEAIESLNQVDDCLKLPSQLYRLKVLNESIRLLELEIKEAQKSQPKEKKSKGKKGWND